MANLLLRLALATRILRGGEQFPDSKVLGMLFPITSRNPPVRGSWEMMRAYAEMPWFRVACDKVAGAVSSVRWRVLAVRSAPGGRGSFERPLMLQRSAGPERSRRLKALAKQGRLVELEQHPLLQLLHDANPFFTGGVHRKLTQIYLDSVGEVGWILERNGAGAPMAMWVVPPHWVREMPSPQRPFFLVQVDREAFPVPFSEMLWFKHPHPLNPFGRGTGLGMALGDELETDEYAARHTKQWFFNSARPDLAVTFEGASEPEIRRAEQHWANRHQGFWRAFKPYFSNRKMDIKEIGHTFREMQLTDLRQQERDVIIQTFGVPPEILGIVERSNRATIESADFIMAKHVTIPRLEFQREVLQERLVPEYDPRLVLDYESPLEEDRQFALEAATAAPWALMVDEWRELQGHDPLDNNAGRVFLTPTTMAATSLPGGVVDAPPAAPAGAAADGGKLAAPAPVALLEEGLHQLAAGAELREAGGPAPVIVPAGLDARQLLGLVRGVGDEFYATVHAIADRLAPKWRKAFLDAMATARGHVNLAELEHALRSGNLEAVRQLLRPEVVRGAISEGQLPGLLRATVVAAGQAAAAELAQALGVSIGFGELNPHSVAYIRELTGRLITEVSDETVQAVRDIIERSFREAIAPRDAARLIREVIGLHSRQAEAVANFRQRLLDDGIEGDSLDARVARYAEAQLRYRALTIARTETIAAANGGQQLLWEQASRDGLLNKDKVRRVWLVTPDDRLDTRICEPMPFLAANKDVHLSDPFTTGRGDQVMTPPAHPNCRCAVALKILD